MENLTIGSRIAELRKKAKLTQNELADKLIISNKAVSKWESDNGYPSLEMLIKLHEVLDCSMDYLILGIEPTKPKEEGIWLDLGVDKQKNHYKKNLLKILHTLIVGDVSSGKSVLLHNIITQIICNHKKEDVKLALIDCKRVEFDVYKNLPHLYSPIATTVEQSEKMLTNLVEQMESRYELLLFHECTNIREYNEKYKHDKVPQIVVIIDEFAELMINGNIKERGQEDYFYTKQTISETKIQRLAQLGSAVGIFVILSSAITEHNVLPKSILNCIPSRIVFNIKENHKISYYLDTSFPKTSQNVGDYLFYSPAYNNVIQLHCPFISHDEIEKILKDKVLKQ